MSIAARGLGVIAFATIAGLAAFLPAAADARRSAPQDDLAAVRISELPAEARETLDRIARGGPYRYSRDGVVFGNRERLLPARPRGYYHEFTVPTPGARDRGARRVVCGNDVSTLAECYYSDDHYQSFRRIRR